MPTVESIVAAHLHAWNAPAGAARTQSISTVYGTDVFIGEPGSSHRGLDGMEQAISGLQAQLPGMSITRTGPIQIAQDLATYSWALGPSGQPPVASGRDVILIRDDVIVSLYVVIDAA